VIAPLLRAKNISKRFGGLQALSQVSLELNPGSITGLIGPNGAGKTTFFNVLTGLYCPDEGSLEFRGEPLPQGVPHEVARRGLARTFQNIRLFSNMSVLENVMVGRHVRSHSGVLGALFRSGTQRREEAEIAERARHYLKFVGLEHAAHRVAGTLSYGDQRRLEIARALATEPQLLALDEPAAGMNATERAALGQLIRQIGEAGIAILLIEHDVRWVMQLCEQVLVLDYGQCIARGSPQVVVKDPRVIEAYLGRGAE
jgi:branched-chain amino acid transport system ATP-binding protein